jgi:hypothetical protein
VRVASFAAKDPRTSAPAAIWNDPMTTLRGFLPEYAFLATIVALSVAGLWSIFVGPEAAPGWHHWLHAVINFLWLGLLWWQLDLVRKQRFARHRTAGLAVLLLAPLLVASVAMLSVHSAQKGIASGRGDPLIIQNVGVTLELALLVVLAFVLRRRRKLHGALLLGTAVLFMGIALFFTLISFAPPFRIEGPDTFYRFGTAAMTGSAICLGVGLAFVLRDWRNGWPMLLAAAFLPVNDGIRAMLARTGQLDAVTAFVASLGQGATFVASFVVLLAALLATGIGARAGSRLTAAREPA